jgi:hypothetical protein
MSDLLGNPFADETVFLRVRNMVETEAAQHETHRSTIVKVTSGFEPEQLLARPTWGANWRGSATVTELIVPQTILAQLGGESFVMTSGATGLVGSADNLTFKLSRNPKRVTHVRVTLTCDGLYDMTFFTIGKGPQSHDGIHREMLQEVFGANTGLYSALQASDKSIRRKNADSQSGPATAIEAVA